MKIYKGWKVVLDCKQYEILGTQSLRQNSYVILKDLQGNKSSMNRDEFLSLYTNKQLIITQ